MQAQINESLEHIEDATSELEAVANINPEVLKLFTRLQVSTARFVRGMAWCQEGAKFLRSHNKVWKWTQELYTGSDEDDLVNLYNCIRCTQQSLKCGVCKTFRPQDIPTFAKTPVPVYQEFISAFNKRVSDKCSDEQVAKRIHHYANAIVTLLIEQIANEKDNHNIN